MDNTSQLRPWSQLLMTGLAVSLVSGCVTQQTEQKRQWIRAAEANLTHEYAKQRYQQVQDVSYQLALSLSKNKPDYTGEVKVDFTWQPGKQPLTLDFVGGQVNSMQVNGKPVKAAYNNWFIKLPANQLKTGRNQVIVQYSHPYSKDGAGLHRFIDPKDGKAYLHTQLQPYDGNKLFPQFDQPNLKATYQLTVDAPVEWQVVTAERESAIERLSSAQQRWHFPRSARFSTYIISLHAGPYQIWEDNSDTPPLRLMARPSMANYVDAEEWFKLTRHGMTFFQDYFGLDYPYAKYDQLIVPEFNAGGMENVAAVTYSERYLTRGKVTRELRQSRANVILHELAHMWFGDLVTADWWNGLWLNESFATYMAHLAMNQYPEYQDSWLRFYSRIKLWAYEEDELVTTHPIEVKVVDTNNAFTHFDGITYGKGAAVLKQLAHYLGPDNFQQGVHNYLKQYAGRNTQLEDFFNSLAAASKQNLTPWVRQWLRTAGVNTISARYQCKNNKISEFDIVQQASNKYPVYRTQRVLVGLYYDKGKQLKSAKQIPVTYLGEVTPVSTVVGRPCPAFTFVNVEDWGYSKVALDAHSENYIKRHLSRITDPLLRSMVWQSQWDQVMAAKLSLTDYLPWALKQLPLENNEMIVRQVVTNLQESYDYLAVLHEKELAIFGPQLENLAWQQLTKARPGSDWQALWFEAFIHFTHTPAGLAKVEDILALKRRIAGLAIDQDLRWQLVVKLNEYAIPSAAQWINQELSRDSSDRAERQALLAKAIQPQTKTKQYWLEQLWGNSNLTLQEQRSLVEGLFPTSQFTLSANYADQIVGQLNLLKEKDSRFKSTYSRLLPKLCQPENVVRLRTALTNLEFNSPVVQKRLKIAIQQEERCVAISQRIKEKNRQQL
ncbi:aminopeptidase N [Endozoicomonas sp. SM1973]|uniref:Aminopeptidase N n=1 Tax=Spartinivicinus marinus TaxID=2994442 RepID=A0A853IIU0_9GAMM|nr:aminopeptidase N [Spartinivicinus marinus]MCX4029784.1 aminopeptidase N [Spartinivicinus marinus]NYZ67546.1 aminopeptidase N [Spartinivicinus marinus]